MKKRLLKAFGWFALIPVSVVLWGYVDMRLWQMFAVPLGAPPIGMAHAFGLGLLGWSMVAHKTPVPDKGDGHEYRLAGSMTLMPVVLLGMGKLAHMIAGLP